MKKELIETIEVGAGGAASIEFTSIPQDGVDLLLLVSARANTVQAMWLKINGSDANLSGRRLTGTGSSVNSTTETVQIGYQNSTNMAANTFGNAQIYISNYTSSSAKSLSIDSVSEDTDSSANQNLNATLWNNTAAITSVLVEPQLGASYPFVQYSTASLYKVVAE